MTPIDVQVGSFSPAQVFWWIVTRDLSTTLALRDRQLKEIHRRKNEPPAVLISGSVDLPERTTFSVCVVGSADHGRRFYQAIVAGNRRWSTEVSAIDAHVIHTAVAQVLFDDPATAGAVCLEAEGGPMRTALAAATIDALDENRVDAALTSSSVRHRARWEGPNACIEADFYEAMDTAVAACLNGDLSAVGVNAEGKEEELLPNTWHQNCFHLVGTSGFVTRKDPALAMVLITHLSGADIRLSDQAKQTPIWRDVMVSGRQVMKLWPTPSEVKLQYGTSEVESHLSLEQLVRDLLAENPDMPQKEVYRRVVAKRRAEGTRPELRKEVEKALEDTGREQLKPGPRGPRKKPADPPA